MKYRQRRKAFTLLELLIVIGVIAILAGSIFIFYQRSILEQAKCARAYVDIDKITKAEQLHRFDTGEYVAAENTAQINALLGLDIKSKYYEYRVVLPDEHSFLVIAQRIGRDIEEYLAAGELPPEPILIVRGPGKSRGDYIDYIGGRRTGSTGETGTETGETESSGLTLGRGETGTTGGGRGTTGGRGGGRGRGGAGGTGETGTRKAAKPPPQAHDPELESVLNLLKGTTAGQYYFDLIERKEISLVYDDELEPNIWGMWRGPELNKIYINEALRATKPESVIASIICHEATHADYTYNPERWISITLERHPELTRADISIVRDEQGNEIYFSIYDPESGQYEQKVVIQDSIDQEYNAFANELELWKEIKGSDEDWNLDQTLFLYELGEAELKANLRTRGSYQDLPEY